MKLLLHLLCLALCLSFASCGDRIDPAGSDPVGTWKIDSDATLAANQAQIAGQLEGVPEAGRAQARSQLEDMFRGVRGTLEIKADKTLVSRTVFSGQEKVMQGTWEIDGDAITTRAKAEGSDAQEIMMGTIEGDRISLAPPGGDQFVVFKRR